MLWTGDRAGSVNIKLANCYLKVIVIQYYTLLQLAILSHEKYYHMRSV